MSDMIERLARADHDRYWNEPWDDMTEADKQSYRERAQSWLRILRDPTPAMVEAMERRFDECNSFFEPRTIFQAGIDDAMSGSAAPQNSDPRPENLDPNWLADVLGHTPMSDGTRLSDKLDRVSLVNVALEITEGAALKGGRFHRRDESKTTTGEQDRPICDRCRGSGYLTGAVCCRNPLPTGECCAQPVAGQVVCEVCGGGGVV